MDRGEWAELLCQAGGPEVKCGTCQHPDSGTPQWKVHVSSVSHLCTFAVATRTFKSKYTNFISFEVRKFNTF